MTLLKSRENGELVFFRETETDHIYIYIYIHIYIYIYVHIYIWQEIYYQGLCHVIVEGEKSHDLPSASWKPRKASGVVPVQIQRLEKQRSQWFKS